MKDMEDIRKHGEKEIRKLKKVIDSMREEKAKVDARILMPPPPPPRSTTSSQGREEVIDLHSQGREEVMDTTQGREEMGGEDPFVPETIQDRKDTGRKETPKKNGRRVPQIEDITDDNRNRLSDILPGCLMNSDGTFTMTPQGMTKANNEEMQLLKELHLFTPIEVENLKDIIDHPLPLMIKLIWSYPGEWILVPRDTRIQEDLNLETGRVARLEKYIDEKGNINRAISYGEEESKLRVWYRLEDLQKILPKWKIPLQPIFYNGKKCSKEMKREDGERRKPRRRKKSEPTDQPTDTKSDGYVRGGRGGRARGGYTRGNRGQNQRGSGAGRGGPTPREDQRWQGYNEWDQQQSSGARPRNNNNNQGQEYEEEYWPENDYYNRPHGEYQGQNQYDYYRPDGHERSDSSRRGKRSRSPSWNRNNARDENPRQERSRGRDRQEGGQSSREGSKRRQYPSPR